MCCCGNGVGTSLIMQMTIEEALEHLGIAGIEVTFGPLCDLSGKKTDLFVVSEEVLPLPDGLPAVGLADLMDAEQAAEQLKKYLEI